MFTSFLGLSSSIQGWLRFLPHFLSLLTSLLFSSPTGLSGKYNIGQFFSAFWIEMEVGVVGGC